MNIFSKRRTATRSINLHKAAQPRGCDSVTVFACLPGLTLHNSRIKHSRFSSGCDPETSWLCNAAQCSYYETVLVAAHALRSQPWCQNRPQRHKRGALLNKTKGGVYSKLQPPSQANAKVLRTEGQRSWFPDSHPRSTCFHVNGHPGHLIKILSPLHWVELFLCFSTVQDNTV